MICHSFTVSRINLPPKPCIYVYNFLTSWLSHFHRINGSYANIPYRTHNHTQLNHSEDITTERLSSEISQVYAHCRLKSTFRRYITQNIFQQLFFGSFVHCSCADCLSYNKYMKLVKQKLETLRTPWLVELALQIIKLMKLDLYDILNLHFRSSCFFKCILVDS